MISNSQSSIHDDQRGMASIVITLVTMIVISLIVLGFATVSRREQGQTLNQQLSTQAFYAAESGVQDAQTVIKDALQAGETVPGKTDCSSNTDGGSYTPNYPTGDVVLDSQHNVSYSCLLVDPSPGTLEYNGVSDSSVVVPIQTTTAMDTVEVNWTPTTTPAGTPSVCPASTAHTLSLQSKWTCGYGLVRVDLVPTDGSLTSATLASSQLTTFFEPTTSTVANGTILYAGNTAKANIIAAQCTTASYGSCSGIVTLPAGTTKNVMLRITSSYQPSNVTITGYTGGINGTVLKLTGAQALVDVTGKASGVLRRIQVRLPLTESTPTPSFAVDSNGSICKRFQVTPGYFSIPDNYPTGNPDNSNPECKTVTSGTPSTGG